jgi:hypothetical protein
MTQALFLVTRAAGDEGSTIDGIYAAIVNKVSTANNAQVIAEAVAQANASKNVTGDDSASIQGPAPFPDNYFDTVVVLSDLSGGPLNADGDTALLGGIDSAGGITIVSS